MQSEKSYNASPSYPLRISTILSLFKTVSQGTVWWWWEWFDYLWVIMIYYELKKILWFVFQPRYMQKYRKKKLPPGSVMWTVRSCQTSSASLTSSPATLPGSTITIQWDQNKQTQKHTNIQTHRHTNIQKITCFAQAAWWGSDLRHWRDDSAEHERSLTGDHLMSTMKSIWKKVMSIMIIISMMAWNFFCSSSLVSALFKSCWS